MSYYRCTRNPYYKSGLGTTIVTVNKIYENLFNTDDDLFIHILDDNNMNRYVFKSWFVRLSKEEERDYKLSIIGI